MNHFHYPQIPTKHFTYCVCIIQHLSTDKSKKKNSQIIEIPVIINAFNIYISVLAHMVCRGTRIILVRICIIYGKSPV